MRIKESVLRRIIRQEIKESDLKRLKHFSPDGVEMDEPGSYEDSDPGAARRNADQLKSRIAAHRKENDLSVSDIERLMSATILNGIVTAREWENAVDSLGFKEAFREFLRSTSYESPDRLADELGLPLRGQ